MALPFVHFLVWMFSVKFLSRFFEKIKSALVYICACKG